MDALLVREEVCTWDPRHKPPLPGGLPSACDFERRNRLGSWYGGNLWLNSRSHGLDRTEFSAIRTLLRGTVPLPIGEQSTYRNMKHRLSQNVLAACNFEMQFSYILAGWEGSAHDTTVLRDVQYNHSFITPPKKYWLGDAGYSNSETVLVPYRSTRYHLKEQRLVWWGRMGTPMRIAATGCSCSTPEPRYILSLL
jgi:hypothetical protein